MPVPRPTWSWGKVWRCETFCQHGLVVQRSRRRRDRRPHCRWNGHAVSERSDSGAQNAVASPFPASAPLAATGLAAPPAVGVGIAAVSPARPEMPLPSTFGNMTLREAPYADIPGWTILIAGRRDREWQHGLKLHHVSGDYRSISRYLRSSISISAAS